MFLGENLLPLLALAMGGALAVGTLAAIIRPRPEIREGELEKPPLVRSIVQIAIGSMVSIWALLTLLA